MKLVNFFSLPETLYVLIREEKWQCPDQVTLQSYLPLLSIEQPYFLKKVESFGKESERFFELVKNGDLYWEGKHLEGVWPGKISMQNIVMLGELYFDAPFGLYYWRRKEPYVILLGEKCAWEVIADTFDEFATLVHLK